MRADTFLRQWWLGGRRFDAFLRVIITVKIGIRFGFGYFLFAIWKWDDFWFFGFWKYFNRLLFFGLLIDAFFIEWILSSGTCISYVNWLWFLSGDWALFFLICFGFWFMAAFTLAVVVLLRRLLFSFLQGSFLFLLFQFLLV